MFAASLETGSKGRDSKARSFAMLTIRNLKKSHGGNTLFENASMQVNYGERVALVGPNGAGKSTIFSIILRHDEPDQGTVDRDEWTMVGFLPQEAEAVGEEKG
jgi:ATP-binding cassette subfamily F protein 3